MQSNFIFVQLFYVEPANLFKNKEPSFFRTGKEWTPLPVIPVTDEQAEDVSKLIDRLEQDEDVQKMFHNMG